MLNPTTPAIIAATLMPMPTAAAISQLTAALILATSSFVATCGRYASNLASRRSIPRRPPPSPIAGNFVPAEPSLETSPASDEFSGRNSSHRSSR